MSLTHLVRLALSFVLVFLFASPTIAQDNVDYDPWEKYSVSVGGFLSVVDTKVSLGSSGVGISLDLEDITGMQSTNRSFRINALGRFGASKKHIVDLSYFYYNRDSSKQLLFDQDIGLTGDTVNSTFNIQIYKLNYNYSLLMDDRVNFSAGIGLYVMPLEYSLENVTNSTQLESMDITAPLPTLNLRLEFALTPKLYLRQNVELFYLKYGGFTGGILDINIGADYRISKHFGLGLGVDSFSMGLEANGKDYPEINFNGDVQFKYVGLMLYGKYYF